MRLRSPNLKSKISFLLLIVCSLIITLSHVPSAVGQFNLLGGDQASQPQSSIDYQRIGNIDVAAVNLDARPIFKVAAPTPDGSDNQSRILPIERRVREIEIRLKKITESRIDPKELEIYTATLNNQPVIFVKDPKSTVESKILTITEPDTFIEFKTQSELAKTRIQEINDALQQSWREHQPKYYRASVVIALTVLSLTSVISVIILFLQRWLRRRNKDLTQKIMAVSTEETANAPMSDEHSIAIPSLLRCSNSNEKTILLDLRERLSQRLLQSLCLSQDKFLLQQNEGCF